jgi:putative ABC transport system permease protein
MLYTRWRKVFADLWSNKTRTILMVLTISLGVFSVGFVGVMGKLMIRDMEMDYQSSNPGQANLYAWPIPKDMVKAAERVPGVESAYGISTASALLRTDKGNVNINFQSVESYDKVRIGYIKPADPLSGAPLPAFGEREVVFERTARTTGFVPGDVLTIELPNGDTRKLRFKGYIHDVTAIPYGFTGQIPAYVTPKTIEMLGGPDVYNQLIVRVSDDQTSQTHVEKIGREISDRYEKSGINVYYLSVYNPGHHFAYPISQGAFFILSTLGWMVVILSGILIINTIVSLMTQQTKQIGIMKAIGADTGQLYAMYVVLILAFGAISWLVSVPLAARAGYFANQGMTTILNYDQGPFEYFPDIVLQQAIVAFVVPLLSALIPMMNVVRIPVRVALSDYGLGSPAAKVTESSRTMSLFPRPVLVSLRNAFRRKARVSLTLFTLVLGGAIFIAVMNLWATMDQTMKDVQGYFLADINISFDRAHHFQEVEKLAMSVPGVESVEGWMTTGAQLLDEGGREEDGKQISIFAPPSDSTLIKPIVVSGRWLIPEDRNAVVIGNHILKVRPDLKVGDWITLKIGSQKSQWQIVGVFVLTGNSSPFLYTNYDYLTGLMHLNNQVYELRVITYQHDAGSQIYISNQLQQLFVSKNIPVSYMRQGAVWAQQQKSQTDLLIYFLLVMAVLIAAVGGIGLTSLMSINVMERTREIGVMRAIGAGDGDVQRIVITEGLVIGLLSWCVAVFLAVPITYVLCTGVGSAIFTAPLSAQFSWIGSAGWLAGILGIAALASAVPAWNASRLTVRDTLVYE